MVADTDNLKTWLRQMTSGRKATRLAARERIVEHFMPKARRLCEYYSARTGFHAAAGELLGAAWEALAQAAERFDPAAGVRFWTYAAARVRGGIRDELRRMDPVKRRAMKLRRDGRVCDFLLARDVPGAEDLYAHKAAPWFRHPQTTEADPHAACAETDAARRLLMCLPRRKKLIMWLYYADGLTMKEIGQVLGLCASRVSQMHSQAIARLRSRVERRESE